MLFSQ